MEFDQNWFSLKNLFLVQTVLLQKNLTNMKKLEKLELIKVEKLVQSL